MAKKKTIKKKAVKIAKVKSVSIDYIKANNTLFNLQQGCFLKQGPR